MSIEIKGLWKVFQTVGGKVEALKGIDLNIANGDTLAVVGVSGSGKSTLLHILGTLEHPSDGEVSFSGNNIFSQNDGEIAAFRNSEIGFVFQFHYLLPEFNALENVMMPCLIKGIDMNEATEMAEDILGKVGLQHRLDHRPGELSGGEQQRVAIARAVVLKPKVLLADEPTGNLDRDTGESILDLLLMLNGDYGITSILVTHNMEIANRLNRRIRLADGKIVDEN
ncbi:MAG: ABC transporter ATP-binding protein [Thermodesulfobacteriales bacterium]|jgi:lipoprotein-releasing system ATP-binding protein|nr:MAG: ABC transporter ATP-binding protein [Thermodesulfobacteriales bacterium]